MTLPWRRQSDHETLVIYPVNYWEFIWRVCNSLFFIVYSLFAVSQHLYIESFSLGVLQLMFFIKKTNWDINKCIFISSKILLQRCGSAKMEARWLQQSTPYQSSSVYINHWCVVSSICSNRGDFFTWLHLDDLDSCQLPVLLVPSLSKRQLHQSVGLLWKGEYNLIHGVIDVQKMNVE